MSSIDQMIRAVDSLLFSRRRLGWWYGVVVTCFIQSTKLLYAMPG